MLAVNEIHCCKEEVKDPKDKKEEDELGPIIISEEHERLSVEGCSLVPVYQSEVWEEFDKNAEGDTIVCEFAAIRKMKVQIFCNNDNKTPLRFSIKNENLETG